MRYENILKKIGVLNKSIKQDFYLANKKKLVDIYQHKIPKLFLDFIEEREKYSINSNLKVKGIDKIPIATDNKVSVDIFDIEDILKTLNIFSDNLDSLLLPIAEGESGDLIVIDLSDNSFAKVYYWDHEHWEGTRGLYLIANNLDEFLDKLFIDDKEVDVSSDDVEITYIDKELLNMLNSRDKN